MAGIGSHLFPLPVALIRLPTRFRFLGRPQLLNRLKALHREQHLPSPAYVTCPLPDTEAR